ncbi:MAG: SRPBCC domain-containing protein [Planctomycetes bacterium]|nr:SRPBCC domain-containing protein [Planctomycetota bacterium]
MLTIQEQTIVNASPETIFNIITDLDRYEEWNPWITEACGIPEEGQLIKVKAKMGDRIISVQHRILISNPNIEFRWCDVGWFTKLAYGERARFIKSLANGNVEYRVELTVTGPFGWFVKLVYGKFLEAGLKMETNALKERAEGLVDLS